MGLSWSKRHHYHSRHRHHHHEDDDLNHHSQPPSSSSTSLNPPPLPLPQPPPRPPSQQLQPSRPPNPPPRATPPPPSFAFAANAPYPSQTPPSPPAPYPPPPPNNYFSYNYSNYSNYARPVPVVNQPSYHPYFIPPPPPPANVWTRPLPPLPGPGLVARPSLLPAVPYVDHQSAKKIKNDINARKDSIKLEVDDLNGDCHLVCFTFDAMVDGSITILYFAKEGANCTFTSVYPEIKPVKVPFQKGLGQKFHQPSGSGIDLGFFDVNDLSKPLQEDVFPLVIVAESTLQPMPLNDQNHEQSVDDSTHAQITLAVLEKNSESQFMVKVIKQILWVDRVRYELREIYGISSSDETTISDQDTGKECVICMTEPKDTTVLPCRHMCMCSECAKALRLQSNKCPICRQPIEELLEIRVDEE